jgi:predicted enzyme related to lactoylglutathione lyase
MIKRVDFVCIPVRDQDRALRFYTEKLGFTVHTDRLMGSGQRWIELSIPGAETRVVISTPVSPSGQLSTGFLNLSLAADDVEQTYRELSARGVEFRGPPKKEPWGWSLMINDPEGNTLHVSSAG